MSTYPIKVSSLSLDHKGGTKSYHISVIETADGRAVFVYRWGKANTFGELKTINGDAPSAWRHWKAKEQDKTRGGYYPRSNTRVAKAASSADLSKTLGIQLFHKIGKDAIAHLDPTFDTSKLREADEPKSEDGELKHTKDTARKADISKELAQMRAEEAAKTEKVYADNPMFGRF